MTTILAPTDFSENSLNAVNYAADISVATGAQLLLLHVIQVQEIGVTEVSVYSKNLADDEYEFIKHKMQLLKNELEKKTGKAIVINTQINEGNIHNAIKETAHTAKPFAIIMSAGSSAVFENFMIGSVSLHIAKHSEYPVLLIPHKAKFASVSCIAFATDLILENASNTIKTLKHWLNVFQAKMDIISVNDNDAPRPVKIKEFADLKKRLKLYDVYFHYIIEDSVPEGIFKYLKKNKPDLMVLMYHKENLLHRLVYRSEFNNIVIHAATPVLIIPN